MLRNIIGGIIIFLGLSFFVLGNMIFNNTCHEFEDNENETKKVRDLRRALWNQKERQAYVVWLLLIVIWILVILFI